MIKIILVTFFTFFAISVLAQPISTENLIQNRNKKVCIDINHLILTAPTFQFTDKILKIKQFFAGNFLTKNIIDREFSKAQTPGVYQALEFFSYTSIAAIRGTWLTGFEFESESRPYQLKWVSTSGSTNLYRNYESELSQQQYIANKNYGIFFGYAPGSLYVCLCKQMAANHPHEAEAYRNLFETYLQSEISEAYFSKALLEFQNKLRTSFETVQFKPQWQNTRFTESLLSLGSLLFFP